MSEIPGKKLFNWRGFTSLILFLCFLLMVITGLILYISPRGRVANWTNWNILGLGKEDWAGIHITASLVMLILAILHLYFNWSIFIHYIKSKRQTGINLKTEIITACCLVVLLVAGTLYGIPPFSTVLNLNIKIKDSWEGRAMNAPQAHAEDLTLEEIARKAGKEPEEVLFLLEEKGYQVEDPSAKFGDIANSNGVSPKVLYEAILPSEGEHGRRGGGPGAGGGAGGGGGRRGMGRLNLGEVCQQEGLNLEEVLSKLAEMGIEADADTPLREIAEKQGMNPFELIEKLR